MKLKFKIALPVLPAVVWFTIFSIIPTVIIAYYSLRNNSSSGFVGEGFTFKNYANIFQPDIWPALKRSFTNSFFVSCALIILSLPVAFQIASSKRFKNLLLLIIIVPFLSSTLLRLYSIIFLFRDTGLINSFINELNLSDEPVSFLYNSKAVFITYLYFYFPFICFPIYSGIVSQNFKTERVAFDLGASYWQTFFIIKIPAIRKSIYRGFALVFLLSLGDFLIPQIIGGDKYLFISNVIYNGFTQTRNWTQSSAIAIEVMLLGIAFVIIFQLISERLFFKKKFL